MNPAILTAIAVSALRHVLTVLGAKAYADEHSSQLESTAGLLVFIGSIAWGAWNAKVKKTTIDDLKDQVSKAEEPSK